MPITRETVLNAEFQALRDDDKLAVLQRLDTGFAALALREQHAVLARLPTQATATDLAARELRRSGLSAERPGVSRPTGRRRSLQNVQRRAAVERRRTASLAPVSASAAQLHIEPAASPVLDLIFRTRLPLGE